ncbi:MAG: hydroxymethylglutaryl-CoA lyase [Flavobacteriaceae bacterium]
MKPIQLIECPRDAMQGIKNWIPTPTKIAYLQQLLRVGFHTLDCGSFVSSKAIPQMADTAEVLQGLDLGETNTRLSVIVANLRGAETACSFPQVDYLGFPFSISENFQMRNTHKTIDDSYTLLQQIQEKALAHNKQLIVYLSMGFGNPYGDPWSPEIVEEWIYKLAALDLPIISLSDTVGTASQDDIRAVFSTLIPRFSHIEFGAHFHTVYTAWHEKVDAAFRAGCTRFDGAIKGHGGCPMAKDELVGNMPTEKLISYFLTQKRATGIHPLHFEIAYNQSHNVFYLN